MLALVATMLLREHWSTRLFEQVSIGPQPLLMQRSWFIIVRGASSLLSRLTFQPMNSRPLQHLGLSHAGDWT
jgi:hypothetical protein